MANIENVIPVVLAKTGEVVIPGVGCIRISKEWGQKAIFTNKEIEDKGTFKRHVVDVLKISIDEAVKAEAIFLKQLQNIGTSKLYIPQVGYLYCENSVWKLDSSNDVLKPEPVKPKSEPEKEISTSTKTLIPPKKTSSTSKGNKKLLFFILVLLLVISGSIVYYLSNISNDSVDEDPIVIGAVEENTTTRANAMDTMPATNDTMYAEEELYSEYYLVAGSFKQLENAMELKIKLETQGFKPVIKLFDNGYYRVIVAIYKNRSLAIESMTKYNASNGEGFVWVLSYK